MNTQSMQACTEAYQNSHWLIESDDGKYLGALKAQPFETLHARLTHALQQHYNEEETFNILFIEELRDEIHRISVEVTDEEETNSRDHFDLTPIWEY